MRMAMAGIDSRPQGHRSALVVDVDYHTARAVLFARVDDQYRFVSAATVPSTAMPPIDDVSVGAKQAIRAIEEHSGLFLVGSEGIEVPSTADHGVDIFALTGQPVTPIRLSAVSVGASPMLTPLVAAARRTVTEVDALNERVRTSDGVLSGVQLEAALREFRPDAVIVIQGDKAEGEWSTAIGTLSGLVGDGLFSLIIIVAGDTFQQQAAQVFGDRADLRGIDPGEFTVADIAVALEAELQGLYEARVSPHTLIASVEPTQYVSRVRAADLVTRFIARRREQAVAYIDVADGLVLHWATPVASDMAVRPDIDLFRNVRSVFNHDLAAVTQWLPSSAPTEDLSHWILNRALRPHTVADTAQDVAIERAILIEQARTAWTAMAASAESQVDVIIAGRPFTTMPQPGLAAMTLLDVIQPDPDGGVVELMLDADGIVPAAGAVGERSPAIAADVVENDLLIPFATALVVRGGGTAGELAVRGQVRQENGDTTRFTVPFGGVHHIPVPAGASVTLTLACESGYSIGGQTQLTDITIGPDGMLRGGEFGVVIDARGRGQSGVGQQVARVKNWFDDLGISS
jgi:hypothetical protein